MLSLGNAHRLRGNLVSICVLVFFWHRVNASLSYAQRAESGTQHWAVGRSTFCNTGFCIDNTGAGKPGKCQHWLDGCLDVAGGPGCGYTEVLDIMNPQGLDAGIGQCYVNGYQWLRQNWTWTCFACPSGYVGVASGLCGGSPYWDSKGHYPPGPCVACSDPVEQLSGDAYEGWSCFVDQPICNLTRSVSTILGGIGVATTAAGALCPGANKVALTSAVLQSIIGIEDLFDPDRPITGLTGTGFGLLEGATASLSSWKLIGNEAAAARRVTLYGTAVLTARMVPWVNTAYTITCTTLTVFSVASTVYQHIQPLIANKACKAQAPVSKRSQMLQVGEGLLTLEARDASGDPCSSFLSHFTGVADAIVGLEENCDFLTRSGPTTNVTSDELRTAIEETRQACGNLTANGDMKLIASFGTFLRNLEAAAPYCASAVEARKSVNAATPATLISTSFTAASSKSPTSSYPAVQTLATSRASTSSSSIITSPSSSESRPATTQSNSSTFILSITSTQLTSSTKTLIPTSTKSSSPTLPTTTTTTTTTRKDTAATAAATISSTISSSTSTMSSKQSSKTTNTATTTSSLSSSDSTSTSSSKTSPKTSTTASTTTTSTSLLQSSTIQRVASPSASSAIANHYSQCGGHGWTGATVCNTGWNCTNTDPNYWQCWPAPYNATYCVNHMYDDCGGSSFNGSSHCCPLGATCSPINQWTNTCQWPQ